MLANGGTVTGGNVSATAGCSVDTGRTDSTGTGETDSSHCGKTGREVTTTSSLSGEGVNVV